MINYLIRLIYFSVSDKMPPFDLLTLRPDGNYTHTGSSKVLFDWVATNLNFTYDNIFICTQNSFSIFTKTFLLLVVVGFHTNLRLGILII